METQGKRPFRGTSLLELLGECERAEEQRKERARRSRERALSVQRKENEIMKMRREEFGGKLSVLPEGA
jgi:hypothetical protein